MKEIKCKGCQHLFWVSSINVNAISMLIPRNKEAVALTGGKYKRSLTGFCCQLVHISTLHTISKIKVRSWQNSDFKKALQEHVSLSKGKPRSSDQCSQKHWGRHPASNKAMQVNVTGSSLKFNHFSPYFKSFKSASEFYLPIKDLYRKHRYFATSAQEEEVLF